MFIHVQNLPYQQTKSTQPKETDPQNRTCDTWDKHIITMPKARVQRFSCKLMATESELTSRRFHQASNGDTLSPGEEWQFKGRTGNDILTERNGRCSSDCEACENRSRSRGESCLEMGDRPDFHAEFHDFPVGKCDDWCLDETVCPDGESVLVKIRPR